MASTAPEWWRKGWPRERVDSMAEAELLSHLAVALKPRTKIGELFRRFPAPEGWGGNYLDPDLAVHGVLKGKDAALFVEYDGYWRHSEGERLSTDLGKNVALLSYAPPSSRIVRIGHWEHRPTEARSRTAWILVDRWNSGSQTSVSQVLRTILLAILSELGDCLKPHVAKRLERVARVEFIPAYARAWEFASTAAPTASGSTKEELADILTSSALSSSSIKLLKENFHLLRFSGERQIRPVVNWLLSIGLSDREIAKAVSRYPHILGSSVENNLQPRVDLFLDLGLTKSQIVKVVATQPQTLGYSLEKKFRPTVEWLLDLGLTKSQVAKVLAISPQICALEIEKNLKSTVQWFLDVGLTRSKIAKLIAAHPSILGLSIEQNLKPTAQWLRDLGLSKTQIAKALQWKPQLFCYSIEQNLKPTVQWLLDLGLNSGQVAKAVAAFPPILGLSIEQNLKPTIQWLLDLGLSKRDVARGVARWPRLVGFSVSRNLSHKVIILRNYFSQERAMEVIAKHPQVLGYRSHRLSRRLHILAERNEVHRIPYAMTLSEVTFQRRFSS